MRRLTTTIAACATVCLVPTFAAADQIRILRSGVSATTQVGYQHPDGTAFSDIQTYDGPVFVDGAFQPLTLSSQLSQEPFGQLSASARFGQTVNGGITEFRAETTAFDADIHSAAPPTKESRLSLDWTFRVFGTNTYMDFFADAYPSDLLGLTLYDETAAVMVGGVQAPHIGAAFSSVALNNQHTYRLRGIAQATFGSDPYAALSFSTNADVSPPVPEPGTLGLLGTGIAVLIRAKRRRKQQAQ